MRKVLEGRRKRRIRGLSRTLTGAIAGILLASAAPAGAETTSQPKPSTALPGFDSVSTPPHVRCEELASSMSSSFFARWRQWWSTTLSRRPPRPDDLERPPGAPTFYLRSPMLSGFFGWGDPADCRDDSPMRKASATVTPCAVVAMSRSTESPAELYLRLPQLGARSPQALATSINERLASGEDVVLELVLGGKYRIGPSWGRVVDARSCARHG